MFKLSISKDDNPNPMKTMNNWIIDGLVLNTRTSAKGLWLTVKSTAGHDGVFTSDKMVFDCFIPKQLIQNNVFQKLHARGKFEFKKSECYFVVNKIIKEEI